MRARQRPVYLLLRPGHLLLDLAAAVEPLRIASEQAGRALFSLRYLALQPQVPSSVGICTGPAEPLPRALPADAIVVLVGTRSATQHLHRHLDRQLARWLRGVLRPGHLLLCICSGALLAGQAGLLDGRACTTHHDLCERLARQSPRARVLENRIFVRDGDVFTSAGVTAGIDLMLFVLGQLHGEALALQVARQLVVYLRRSGDDPQLSPLLAHRNHLHAQVHKVQDAVVLDCRRGWSLPQLARTAGLSPRQLTRRFHEAAGTTPLAYVQLVRAARARELLETSALPVERVAEEVGFGSARQFRRVFEARYGLAPSLLQKSVTSPRRATRTPASP
jgi:transcriptional regulator GlxA family with amidase domain